MSGSKERCACSTKLLHIVFMREGGGDGASIEIYARCIGNSISLIYSIVANSRDRRRERTEAYIALSTGCTEGALV